MRRPDADALLHPCDAARAKLLGRPASILPSRALLGASAGGWPVHAEMAGQRQSYSAGLPFYQKPATLSPLSPQPIATMAAARWTVV